MTPSAVSRLQEPVRAVEPTPKLVSADTDVDAIVLGGKRMSADLRNALVDAVVDLQIESAPSLELSFRDPNLTILRSGVFGKGNLDGDGITAEVRDTDWRLVGVAKSGDNTLTATFEDEVCAALRGIKRVTASPRGKLTRAQFIKSRLHQLRPSVKLVCPELNERQAIGASGKGKAVSKSYGLPRKGVKVKSAAADGAQRRNIETVLDEGIRLGVPRKLLEAAVAAATQESTFKTGATNGQHVGLFQMNAAKGTVAQRRNAKFAARWFYTTALAIHERRPSLSIAELCEEVERSGNIAGYRQWVNEAKRTVTQYMGDDSRAKGNRAKVVAGKYLFSIGPPAGPRGESYWDGFQRLATEVEWRFFVVSNVAYYASEPRLFATKPVAVLNEDDEVVRSLDFVMDSGMRTSEATMEVDAELWSIMPGSTIELEDAGPATGKWLVTGYRRSLFDTQASVTLRKPKPKLPEPVKQESAGGSSVATTDQVPAKVAAAYKRAQAIAKGGHVYVYGGRYDCSRLVSTILEAAGALSSPTDTVGLGRVGKSGEGRYMTFYVRPLAGTQGHTYIVFNMPGKGEERFEAHGPAGTPVGFKRRGTDGADYQARHIEGL